MRRNCVKYVYSPKLIEIADQNTHVSGRATLTHDLIKSYGLLRRLQWLKPRTCSFGELRAFHSSHYLRHLVGSGDECNDSAELEKCGLEYDCNKWEGVKEYAYAIAGGTVSACAELCRSTRPEVIINWTGGWHHAERSKASGFCYVNDIVLGILELRKRFRRVLYVDLDAHHGNGVEDAFQTTRHVLTLSFHQHECGYYPGTGAVTDCGMSNGLGYAVNFPYRSGIAGRNFRKYYKRITSTVLERYQPDVCVIQCGADAIVGDPLGGTNLTAKDLIDCIQLLIQQNLPTLLLGGGGYNFANAARYWTQITAALVGKPLLNDISDLCDSFLAFGPDYTLYTPTEDNRNDMNTDDYLEECALSIEEQLELYAVCAV